MYEIRGKYLGEPWETIDEAETYSEAKELLSEYRIAFGSDFSLRIVRVK